VAYEQNEQKQTAVYSKRIRAGKRRTYFFDIKETKGNDFYLTITESRKRFDTDGFERHKIFVYKEDFNKFMNGLTDTVNHVKTELMPNFDFDAFSHDYADNENGLDGKPSSFNTEAKVENNDGATTQNTEAASDNGNAESVDKW
jgi:chloramphenicol O-acetyltransferase